MSWPSRRLVLLAAAGCVTALAPAGARAQQAPAAPASPDDLGSTLDPASPLSPMPDIGVDWPDLSPDPAEAAAATDQAVDLATVERRYGYRIAGIDNIGGDLFRQRFEELSTLRANEAHPANAAQIDRRAREDAALLNDLLRNEGYFDARVTTSTAAEEGRLLVTLLVEPGPLYRFQQVTLPGAEDAGAKAPAIETALRVRPQDPVNGDAIEAGEDRVRTAVGREGFPFARVRPPVVVVDHATRTATLEMPVTPGGERRFGRITTPDARVFDGEHVQEIARFDPGDPYDAAEVDDLRRAIVQTGLVSSVRVREVEGVAPGTVDLNVALEPAPPRTIAGELGYGTGEGARAEVSWTHRNLFPPEGALTVRGVLGTREQLGALTFRRNNFRGRDRVLTGQISASHLERDAYEADTFSVSGALERQTNIFFQKTWTWSLGAELVATDERDVIVSTGEPRRRTYFIAAAPTSLNYDGSDDLLNPTRGFRLGARVSPELSLSGKAFGYTRAQIDASAYQPVRDGVVVAGRVRLGSILGAPRDAVAPSRRFYAGGGASVRGYGYQDIGPRDPNNDPIGGRSLAEFSLEARVRAFGNFGVVPFLDGGNIYTSTLPDFSGFRYGAGLGVRYYSSFGPIRIDVGTPLNPQKGDPRVAVYVSLGQAF
ncbi:autotransporter assembly complex protein TamA [Sphingomonas desiccabilis]|uniref:Outer membrane protein assembly factor n=1 Tax=Sphingomonas desiccabilis TaxID=429134 RepID=A0A4Q2IUR8_9SPHN|nr:BamA/TamA family outer membrane protein [Sphingomonas desiccabilis]MBB3911045.1 translocation and assembly module TamA [Sphingomonas desiccabilis]RXZ32138.1 outer membrane protein assembly factor [Sphingomonas desiccabilis]